MHRNHVPDHAALSGCVPAMAARETVVFVGQFAGCGGWFGGGEFDKYGEGVGVLSGGFVCVGGERVGYAEY